MKDLLNIPWEATCDSLNEGGFATIPSVLSAEDCQELVNGYDREGAFRSTISMERYRFGKGEYKYYGYPLPPLIETLRTTFYNPLAGVANQWMQDLRIDTKFPGTHAELVQRCQSQGQTRPTPLILHYTKGGFNTLHQDLYGEVYFPFQVVFLLSNPGQDFKGGEFILIEQLPRAQSRARVLRPNQGDAVIFTTNFRPVLGSKGYYRARMKHGVSEVLEGERYAMGVIFHDAA